MDTFRDHVTTVWGISLGAVITIQRGHSDDGGFNYTRLISHDMTDRQLYMLLGDTLRHYGVLRTISGYEVLAESAIARLGETFTVSSLLDYTEELERQAQEREEMRRKGLVRCDCGHVIHKSQRMMTSRGSSCPACYDRMSD